MTYRHFIPIGERVRMIKIGYPDIEERIKQFMTNLEMQLKKSRNMMLEVVRRVEYLNESFF